MKKKICPFEKEVIIGLREQKMSEELQRHLTGCPVCQNVALVQGWMQQFKENALDIDMRAKVLPDAERIWRKAHARARPDKRLVRKALRPLIIPQVLFYGLLGVGVIYTAIWGFKKFGNILDSRVTSTILPFFGIMMFIVLVSLSFCAIVLALDKRKHPA